MLGGNFSQARLKPYATLHCVVREATIAVDTTTSNEIDTEGYPVLGFDIPSTFNGVALAIHACAVSGGTFKALYDSDGNAIALVVAASRCVGLTGVDAQAVAAFRYLKLVADTQTTTATVIPVVLKG